MDRGAWWAAVHDAAESWTQLSDGAHIWMHALVTLELGVWEAITQVGAVEVGAPDVCSESFTPREKLGVKACLQVVWPCAGCGVYVRVCLSFP